jgi:hypothetical protein
MECFETLILLDTINWRQLPPVFIFFKYQHKLFVIDELPVRYMLAGADLHPVQDPDTQLLFNAGPGIR